MATTSLCKLLENVRNVRRRFRRGGPWIHEPTDALGENPLQTTRALQINCSILRAVLKWMPTKKVSIKKLEPEVGQDSNSHAEHRLRIRRITLYCKLYVGPPD